MCSNTRRFSSRWAPRPYRPVAAALTDQPGAPAHEGELLMASRTDRLRVRNPVVGPRGGGLYVSELQYARLMEATFAVVARDGYQGMAVRRVTERAGISAKTFYDLFANREECFLAAFDYGASELAARVEPFFKAEEGWVERIRAAVGALLSALDGEPALRRLLFLEALAAGPRVLARRTEVARELATLLDEGRVGEEDAEGLPPLMAEGVVGAAFSVIHARLSEQNPEPLTGLLNGLMAAIVLPYRGRAAAAQELTRKTPRAVSLKEAGLLVPPPLGSAAPVDFRLTVRTQAVLAAVEERPRASNRDVAELAGIHDQGQVSRLMLRLSEQGLVKDTRAEGDHGRSQKEWHLTQQGDEILRANLPLQPTRYAVRRKREQPHAVPAQAKSGTSKTAQAKRAPVYRITPRTRLVLAAVEQLSGEGEDVNPSNREVASAAGVKDQGQISKILARLQNHGFLRNTGGQTAGIPNAWQLTPQGREILDTSRQENRGGAPSHTEEQPR